MENAVFANGFEDHIEGAEGLSSKDNKFWWY